jgi:hypothetical protein
MNTKPLVYVQPPVESEDVFYNRHAIDWYRYYDVVKKSGPVGNVRLKRSLACLCACGRWLS